MLDSTTCNPPGGDPMPIVAALEPPAFAGEVQPRAALLWYEAEGRGLGTLHPLSATRRGQAVIGAGRPFAHRDLQEWLALLAGQPDRAAVAWLPSTVLAHGPDFTVWWRPARVGPMGFLLQGQRFGVRVPWPPLLFVAREQRLWCAALAEDARPEPETPLFHAPLMNVDASGQVCLGTADVPPDGTLAYCTDWEAALCATNFTHVNHRQTLRVPGAREAGTEAHFAFWQRQHERARFPTDALVPWRSTGLRWVEAVLG